MSASYAKGAERIWRSSVNWETANIKAVLVKNTYVQDLNTHEFLSDISAYVTSTPVSLTGKAVSGRTIDANDVTFTAVPIGDVVEALVFYIDTGTESTSPLLLYIDDAAGFPFTGSGGDQLIQWSNGANKIASL